jgi:hypothetical protein
VVRSSIPVGRNFRVRVEGHDRRPVNGLPLTLSNFQGNVVNYAITDKDGFVSFRNIVPAGIPSLRTMMMVLEALRLK